MEHSLHVLTVCFVVKGLIDLERDRSVPALLLLGVCLGPLVRFEALALSCSSILVLAYYGQLRAALLCTVVILASLCAFV